jgi:4-amino-4-deoxy-L-arabinose transferase-like glycosyltransferase
MPRTDKWICRYLAALLILLAAGFHLSYLAYDCPLDLAADEAHYWDWSRHLDWNYYSKGPGVAFLIRTGTALAAPLSQRLTGSDMLAVRLPAVVCGGLLLVSLYILTVQVYRRERLALAVVALALTLPPLTAGATLMTIDAPYTCCWGWALVCGYQALARGGKWAWPLTGLLVGLGILAKYTMVLWLPSAGLMLLTCPEGRRLLWQPGFWIMSVVAAACCLPMFVWNIQHDWVSVRHVSTLAGFRDGGGSMRLLGPLTFVGVQFALLLGYWFVVWAAAMVAYRPWQESDTGVRYLWWMSAPMFVFFCAFGLKTGGGEPNWPVTAYLSGLVLAVHWISEQLQRGRGWYRRLAVGNLAVASVCGVALIVVMHHTEWLYPVLARWTKSSASFMPLRKVDPTCRLRGWRALAADVDQIREKLRREGIEPIVAGGDWTVPGELAFYCQGHPTVYSLGPALGDRGSQYDWWRPNPIGDPEQFRGQTMILVGSGGPLVMKAFERVESPHLFVHYEKGQPVAAWPVMVCRGYHGFPRLPENRDY